ncbi:MAG TPA: hypothetical protein VIW92_02515 [Thermoanaerobaculia bacterium]
MIVNGIEYLDEDVEFFPDGSIHDATLARDTMVQDLPCAEDRSVVFYPSGRLQLAWLASPAEIQGVPCAADTVLYLHENGRVLNTSLGGDCSFGGLALPAGSRVSLNEDGSLLEYSQRLESDGIVEGLPCSAAFHVWRYPGGQPSLVVLAAPHVIGGQEYPRGAEIAMAEDGEVLDAHVLDLDSGWRYQQRVFGVYEAD